MSTTLREFLRQQAAKHETEARANAVVIAEWRTAVERLFGQVRAWLADSDPDRIIEVVEKEHDISEPGLGRYSVPRLDLRAFGKWIGIIPKACKTVASAAPPQRAVPERAAGRVDMTDEVRRYVLYRFPQEGGDAWLIDDLRSEPKPLNQQTFEAALMSYLR